jgi:SAM-dependent methyltransferase
VGATDDRAPEAERREFVSASNEGAGTSGTAASILLLGVREGYERWAPIYDQNPNPVLAREERYVEPFIENARGKQMLDLACGTGRWLQKALAKGIDCGVGVDCSDAMLHVARKKSPIHASLIQADCLNLPFPSRCFDFLVCSFALAHIADLQAMLRECARVVKAYGEVIVSDLHPEAFARGWRTGFRDADSAVHIEVFPRSAEDIVRTFHTAGLECVTCESLFLGEPERRLFKIAKKEDEFAEACQVPAVLVCRLRVGHIAAQN